MKQTVTKHTPKILKWWESIGTGKKAKIKKKKKKKKKKSIKNSRGAQKPGHY
jgi:hypothetical protein